MKVLAIVGPTASGKTRLALEIAEKIPSEIISCDSVQVYKYFDIGTAKVGTEERQLCPHHLIDVLEPCVVSHAGWWRNQCLKTVEEIYRRDRLPIIVGGTALYLKALYVGMFEMPSRNDLVRQNLEQRIQRESLESLFQELCEKDFEYVKKISSNDKLRIVRALEAITVTGIKFSELHRHNVYPNWEWKFILMGQDKDDLKKNIVIRSEYMMASGLIKETEALLEKFDRSCAPFSSVGYRHILNYLDGVWSYEKMFDTLVFDTQKLAKRQMTFFRGLLKDVVSFNAENIYEEVQN